MKFVLQYIFSILTFSILILYVKKLSTQCMAKDECQCNTPVDLVCNESFTKSSFNASIKYRFDTFTLFNTDLVKLPSNAFGNLSFREFFLHHNKNLTTIEENAFSGSENSTVLLYLHSCSIRGNSVFKAIAKLLSLIELNLDDNQIEEIPDSAFGAQHDLKILVLARNKIAAIGQMPFKALINLEFLNLESNYVQTIDRNVFAIESNRSLDPLSIDLRLNKISEIAEQAFKQLQMPVHLDISFNNLTELRKTSFEHILAKDMTGVIVKGNPIECDCRVKWIYENSTYKSKFSGPFRCADKQYFADLTEQHFENCTLS